MGLVYDFWGDLTGGHVRVQHYFSVRVFKENTYAFYY